MPKEDIIPERVAMQVLPVGGLYSALEEEKRRAREEAMRREMEERAKKEEEARTRREHRRIARTFDFVF